MLYTRILVFLSAILLASCIHHKAFIAKPVKSGQALVCPVRINGAYYGVWQQGNLHKEIYLFFYTNGIVLSSPRYGSSRSLSDNADSIRSFVRNDPARLEKLHMEPDFGGFTFTGDTVTIQVMTYIPQFEWEDYTLKGTVLNDSTINIFSARLPSRPTAFDAPFRLRFMAMDKPDSLTHNRWKGKNWYWKQ